MNLPAHLLLVTLFCFRLIFLNLVLEDLILNLVNFKEVKNSVIEPHFMFPGHLTFVAWAEATKEWFPAFCSSWVKIQHISHSLRRAKSQVAIVKFYLCNVIQKHKCFWVHKTRLGILVITGFDTHKVSITHVCKQFLLRDYDFTMHPVRESIFNHMLFALLFCISHKDTFVFLVESFEVRDKGIKFKALPVHSSQVGHWETHFIKSILLIFFEICDKI